MTLEILSAEEWLQEGKQALGSQNLYMAAAFFARACDDSSPKDPTYKEAWKNMDELTRGEHAYPKPQGYR
ncbi:MAG: hypothetical protein H6868_03580 [Rhodospirillales bacterium]|nr:hypothetical protein [Rhodospirillales bacterium]